MILHIGNWCMIASMIGLCNPPDKSNPTSTSVMTVYSKAWLKSSTVEYD